MALLNFDASQIAPDTGVLDAIPAGWYNVSPDASEIKPTKDGAGSYLEIRMVVLDGQYKDRKLFSRFNLRNNNPQAVEIAYKQLSALCHAVGLLQVQDSQQLHGRPLKVKVSVKPADGQYEAGNEIKAYRNINDNTVGNGPTAAGAQGGFAAPGAATPYGAPGAAAVPPAAAPQAPAWQPPTAQQPWQQQPQQQTPPAWAAAPAQQPEQFQQQQTPPVQPQFQQQHTPPAQYQQVQTPPPQQPQQQFQQPQGAPGGAVPPWMQGQPAQ